MKEQTSSTCLAGDIPRTDLFTTWNCIVLLNLGCLKFSAQPPASHPFVLTFIIDSYSLNCFSSCNVTALLRIIIQIPCKKYLALFKDYFSSQNTLSHWCHILVDSFYNTGFSSCFFVFPPSILSSIFFSSNLVNLCFIYALYKPPHIWLVNLFYL